MHHLYRWCIHHSMKSFPFKKIVQFLAWSAIFALIYAQAPLYSSNQNTYFLHGLAKAGYGFLEKDWLANTLDSLPVFTALVQWTYSIFRSGYPFYVYYALQLGVYFFSLLGITDTLFDIRKSKVQTLIFIGAFFSIHSAAFHYLLSGVLSTEAPFLLESGVASQRLLGPVFQPSTFGVFLVLSLFLFLRDRYFWTIIALVVSIYFHSVYLLTGTFMVVGFLWVIWKQENSLKPPLIFGAISLALILPILLYTVYAFWPTSPQISQQANDLMINFRIPHHTIVAEWLDWTVWVQVGIILIAMFLIRKSKLFPIFTILFSASLLLTILQIVSQSDTLALLYPWRISALLVPVSTSILLAFLAKKAIFLQRTHSKSFEHGVKVFTLAVIILLVSAGWTRFKIESDMVRNDQNYAVMSYAAKNHSPDDVYIIPPKMRDFRLVTGIPIYIDSYSIPYHDTDFLEWYQRVKRANAFYRKAKRTCDDTIEFMADVGATHLLLPVEKIEKTCLNKMEIIYQDEYNLVFVLQDLQ